MPKENKVVGDYPVLSVRKVNEEKRATLEMLVNPDTTVTRGRTVRLDCPVTPEKWDLEAFRVKEVSLVYLDPQEFQEAKVDLAEKVTPDLLEQPALLDKPDLRVPSALPDPKEFSDPLDHRVLVAKTVFLVYLVLMVRPDTMAIPELLEIKDTAVRPDLRDRWVFLVSADPKETKEPEV